MNRMLGSRRQCPLREGRRVRRMTARRHVGLHERVGIRMAITRLKESPMESEAGRRRISSPPAIAVPRWHDRSRRLHSTKGDGGCHPTTPDVTTNDATHCLLGSAPNLENQVT